jgi:hypothetical protein
MNKLEKKKKLASVGDVWSSEVTYLFLQLHEIERVQKL